MRFEVFKDANFLAGCLFQVVVGVGLFGTMALITPFTQHVLGYPIITAGYVLGSRGVGTMIAMIAVGRLLKYFEARTVVFVGLMLLAGTLYVMIGFTTNTSITMIVVTGIIQGMGIGFDLRRAQHRVVCDLAQPSAHQRRCAAHADPQSRLGDRHLDRDRVAHQQDHRDARATRRAHHPVQRRAAPGRPLLDTTTDQGRALIDAMLTQQATVIAYQNDFKLLMIFTLVLMPFVLIIGAAHKRQTPAKHPPARVPTPDQRFRRRELRPDFRAVLAEGRHRAVAPRLAGVLRRRRRGPRSGRSASRW